MKPAELIGKPDRWARLLAWATFAGLACGVSGPFGSYAANLFTRLAYWTGLFWIGTALLWTSLAYAVVYGERRHFPRTFAIAIAVLVGCVPIAMLAAGGCRLFWPWRASGVRPLEWYGQTLFVAMPGAALAYWLELGRERFGRMQAAPAYPDAAPQASTIPAKEPGAARLPDHLVNTAICLQMEDHYVRVHRHAHSSLHLAAMRDLVRELGVDRGLQVHRSWWVAHGAVRTAEEDGRAVTLILTNGLRVPVARNRVALLREQGWLATARAEAANA